MFRISSIATILTTLSLFSWADSAPEADIRILQPSMYHGEEIDANTGETWWGLYPDGDEFTFRPTIIGVELVNDGILDDEDEATGKLVTVPGDVQPLMLIHGLPNPKEGPVNMAFNGLRFLFPGDSEALTVNWKRGRDYKDSGDMLHLSAIGTVMSSKYGARINDYKIILYRNLWNGKGESQQLAATDQCSEDGQPVLLWAGDLDGDGKLDLLMDLTDHYNITAITLFLSTSARDGEIVGKTAELVTYGC